MVRWLGCAVLALGMSLCAQAQAAELPPNRALHALFEREFLRGLQVSPESATFVGVEGFNDRLDDRSPAAVAAEKAHGRALLRELLAVDGRRLNTQDRISRQLMVEQLRSTQAVDALYGSLPFSGRDGWLVVGPDSGPQHEFAALAKASPFRRTRDYEHYLQRLAAMPRALAQMTALMRQGMRSGWLPPAEVMGGVPGQFSAYVAADVGANPLFAPFKSFPVNMPAPEQERLAAAARQVLSEQVQPAFAAMRRFLEQEYIPACRPSLAASSLPGGPAYYALAVRDNTTTELTPQQVHQIGLDEVVRIGARMDKLIAQIGFQGTRSEFMQSTKRDKRFYFTDPAEMLKAYRDIAKRVDAELPKLFAELPRQPYGIRAMEAYEGDAAEHYSSGALDGSRAGFFEANVLSLDTRPSYDMENTLLHEAVPGHHLQSARALEIKGLPAFRRSGWYVAYGEGWALYAESLGPELGLYKDPYARFGALTWEMLRAARLVVDTGLHAFGWSRAQAVRYLVDTAGISEGLAVAEVDRYVVTPGQALGYKIGELKIKALRRKAEAVLGERFDIRRFHNALLDDGPLPLTLLEARIDEWIAGEQRQLAQRGSAVRRAR
ncbi:DUF885 domain-containing protein [Ideonella sp. BN130291]|uniref:DUF885 domain-containing protein n=1 Tax=Ideonella sp. BN130291 TaxID=3112940 RepID=UPI002E26B7C8|nr:DUF885 domain-containing protein [Ideonella sp. BN130291]